MATRDTLEQLAEQLTRQIGSLFGQSDLPGDVQRNLRALIQAGLSKMDLVTRDEFDAQAAVLERTRAKLDQLEVQLIDLAKQLEPTDPH